MNSSPNPEGPSSPQQKLPPVGESTRPTPEAGEEQQTTGAKKTKQRTFPCAPPGYPWGQKKWLKANEVWWEYGISPRSLRRFRASGELVASKIMRDCLYDRNDIEKFLRNSK